MRIPYPAGLRVGTDIVAYKRLLHPDRPDKSRFLKLTSRILTDEEQKYLVKKFPFYQTLETQLPGDRRLLAQWFAGRLAAKEAAKKAWGADLISWKDLAVEVAGLDAPVIVCNPFRDPYKSEQEASLSISHDGDYAVATVIATPLDSVLVTELQRRKHEAQLKAVVFPSMAQKFSDPSHYEHGPCATAVDHYTSSHLLNPSRNKWHDVLEYAYNNSIAKGLPDMACYPSQGKHLAIHVRTAAAENILEVGTLGGYSTIWMATAGEHVKVTTIEADAHHKAVAEENIANAGMSNQIEVLLGQGVDVLPRLRDEVLACQRKPFDFVFIDADKQNNVTYFNLSVEMSRPGTGIYVDNVVRKGKLADPEAAKEDGRIAGSRALVETVGRNDKVEAVVLQTISEKSYDGFLMAVVK